MITRCNNANNRKYSDYGGRGIKVCPEWFKFENFISDMGERPPGTTIGRINNNGNYDPSNCEWQGVIPQARNKRNTVTYNVAGVKATMAEHCKFYGIKESTVKTRLLKLGWEMEKSFTTPINLKYRNFR